jgi:PhzF family phenazine biosynthesis protein
VDAFTAEPFNNPAAVWPLESFLDDATWISVATENNLSAIACIVPNGDGYELRRFTPRCEVKLCGHATLASGVRGDAVSFYLHAAKFALRHVIERGEHISRG